MEGSKNKDDVKIAYTLTYFQIPVYVKVVFGSDEVNPFFSSGPALGIKTGRLK